MSAGGGKNVIRLITNILILGVLSACTSIDELKSTKSYPPKLQREGTVNVASRATGIESNKVGKTTVLFMPVGSIKTEGDTSANIMKSVSNALSAAGYNSRGASFTSADAGYLKAHVEEVKIGNFFFSTWGTIILHLRLETRDGALLWKKRLRTSVSFVVNNYDRTAKVTMNQLVKEMSKVFVEEDFLLATQRVKRHNEFLEDNEVPVKRIENSTNAAR